MIKNPALYVQIGNAKYINILKEETHRGAACLHLDEYLDEPIDKLIRGAKASLQSGEILSINAQRVNIYVIAVAHDPRAAQLVLTAGERLRALFAEDFAAYHITLAVLLDESNEPDRDGYEYEARTAATYKFLASLTGDTAYNRIFLLSNRNELGGVSPANHANAYRFLAYLPLLHELENSRFDEAINAMAAETGRVLFASAGLGAGEPAQDVNRENRALYNLALVLESCVGRSAHTLRAPVLAPAGTEPTAVIIPSLQECSSPAMSDDIASVASTPLSLSQILSLRTATITEAETIIFGETAANFFNTNYPLPNCEIPTSTTLPLHEAAAEEMHLAKLLDELTAEINRLTHELSQKERTRFGFLHTIDNAKTAIGQIYAIKYRLAALQDICEKCRSRHAQLHSYIEYIREVIAALKNLPTEPPAQTPPEILLVQARERAVLNISLLRHDGMLQESHILGDPGNPCVLRLIGGFTLEDLTRYRAMRLAIPPQTNA